MNKRTLGIIGIIAMVSISLVNINYNKKKNNLSNLALENLNALASCESDVES